MLTQLLSLDPVHISKYIKFMTKTLEQKRLKAYLESAKSAWTRGHLEAMVRGSSKKTSDKKEGK